MPNWDDQFDFDDLQDNKKVIPKSKPNNNTKNMNHDDQFFDDIDDTKKQKKPILPTINSRNSASSKPNKQQSIKNNPYADKSFGSKQIMDDNEFQEQILDQQPQKKLSSYSKQKQIPKTSKPHIEFKNKNQIKKNESYISPQYQEEPLQSNEEDPFHQSLINNKSLKSIQVKQNKSITESVPVVIGKSLQDSYTSKKLQQQPDEPDEYQEQFENENYDDDDFEEDNPSPVKNMPKNTSKPKQQHNQIFKLLQEVPPQKSISVKNNNLTNQIKKQPAQKGQSGVPPKPPTQDKKTTSKDEMKSNKNINKIESRSVTKPLKRSSSRQSIRSNGEKSIKASRISQKNQSQFFPNRHQDIVTKSFPHEQHQLNPLSQFQINKINQKMRAMIKKFNQQLNDLINKNMLLLKNKGSQKNQNVNDKIRELQVQKKTGQTSIEVMEKNLQKLHGRAGQLKQEEYQLILERKIQQKKTQIKQTIKQITNIKRDVDSKGKKLTIKQVQQKNAQNIHHLKTILIQSKKDQEKGDQRIQKLVTVQEDLETKISDMSYKLDQLISEAKQKGITIENNDQLIKKFQQFKIKLENSKNFNKKTQSLINTKIDILNHQNQQVKIAIRNINSQIHNLYGSIDHSQGQAIKLIERAKEKSGINPLFAENLEKLLKQIEESRANNDYFDNRSEIKSRRSDTTKTRQPIYSNNQSIEKHMPLRSTQSQNKLLQNEEILSKPKFTKKKPNEQHKFDIQNKSQVNQRIWNNEEENKLKIIQNDENRKSIQQISKKQHHKQKIQTVEQQKKDKSKPFMLKKNKLTENKQKSFQNNLITPTILEKPIQQISLNIPIEKEEHKKDQNTNINLAPRMMRFGRKKNEEVPSQNNIPVKDNAESQKNLDKKEDIKINSSLNKNDELRLQIGDGTSKKEQEGQKAIFVPKRFNLRNKAQKKDDSYMPSVQKDNSYVSSATNNVEKIQSPKKQTTEEYKPKVDFKNEQFKVKQQPISKKQPQKPNVQEPQIKPRFNLRLRDRSNKANDNQQGYAPNIGANKNLYTDMNQPFSNSKVQINLNAQKTNPIPNQIANNQPLNKKQTKHPYNPYDPKVQPSNSIQNKNQQIDKNMSSQTKSQNKQINPIYNTPINPVNNPYATKFQTGGSQTVINEPPKRDRGPLKKNKIVSNVPKQSFNIYAQADDITNQVKEIGGIQTANKNIFEQAVNKPASNKKQELNLNDMLGIQKEKKKNDFDDLLMDVGGMNSKNKKKNNDFFSDLQF